MLKLQDSAFTLLRTTNLSPAVCSYLQSADIDPAIKPIGGIFNDTKYGWLSLGSKFCVIDLRTGLKIAAWNFSTGLNTKKQSEVRCVDILPTPLTERSLQLLICVEIEDNSSLICVFHVTGSQILHVIKTKGIVTNITVADSVNDSPFSCFDGIVLCGTDIGEVFVFDLNRSLLLQALKDISQGVQDHIKNEAKPAKFIFLPPNNISIIDGQRELAVDNELHLGFILNYKSHLEEEYLFQNPDGSIRMRAKIGHVHISAIQYIPQLNSVAVGFNFGAFQIWNLKTLDLVFTSSVNVECLPVSHFGFQEPCDDPRACCYLWAIYSVIDCYEEDEFPLAVMYSLTFKGKRMLTDTEYLYEELITTQIMFQLELSKIEGSSKEMVGGRCISCHTYSIPSTLGDGGEDSMLNLCQLVWECWNDASQGTSQHGMLIFDLDQWYKAQMPATYHLQSSPFMSAVHLDLAHAETRTLDLRLCPNSVLRYSHATRLEEHFYPNSLQYKCVCLNSSEISAISTVGIQRQIINGMNESGPTMLLAPNPLYRCCVSAGLHPMYHHGHNYCPDLDEQRRYLLSVALEARLSCFLKRCAHDWAAGAHASIGCTLTFLVDWSWDRAITLKQNAKELIKPLFSSSSVPDWNIRQNLEHCVRQLTQLTSLLDDVLTKCCNLVVPDALSEIEEKFKGIGTVSLYFQVVQWFLTVGLLPERQDIINFEIAPLLGDNLVEIYQKRRTKLHRLMDEAPQDPRNTSCALLYVDQLIDNECGGDEVYEMWRQSGSRCGGLYPPPSLSALLRLYLSPKIPQQHKHALVLYLLLDYCMLYESEHEIRYEATIKRLMQFPTLFGLSNTAIKATQAFWHLDHRDFDFALDQLQCLTGNTLSPWQHHVVLSSLLAQKKTQAALQYLHVRKPPPIQNHDKTIQTSHKVNDHVKLEDWQSSCDLYLARGLVFEALDVVRTVVQNATDVDYKIDVMNYFYNGCKNTGQLSKVLKLSLLPYEEEIFIRYLENCEDPQTSDILVMYLLQQGRYIEAQQYNTKLKSQTRADYRTSQMSLSDGRDSARDILVDVMCSSQPNITHTVAQLIAQWGNSSPVKHVIAPKPMSVFVKAKSPKNNFTYKSTFIQDTIENASETWINKPALKRGVKRVLNIEDTPFICTPKLNKSSRSIFNESRSNFDHQTPSKRLKLNFSGTPKKSASPPTLKLSAKVQKEMESLLEMPDLSVISPPWDTCMQSRMSRENTPHSILKSRRMIDDETSSVDSRSVLVCDSDDDDDSVRTRRSHSIAKHLQFTIPSDSPEMYKRLQTPDIVERVAEHETEHDSDIEVMDEDSNISVNSRKNEEEHHPQESPPKKLATDRIMNRRSYKDSVRSRNSLSLPINSSLSDDPNSSVESIADIPFTLINTRLAQYQAAATEPEVNKPQADDITMSDSSLDSSVSIKSRRSIRSNLENMAESVNRTRGRSSTPIKTTTPDPVITRNLRSRSRSKTPERISSPVPISLEIIPEQSMQEDIQPHEDSQSHSEVLPANSLLEQPRKSASKSPVKTLSPSPSSPSASVDIFPEQLSQEVSSDTPSSPTPSTPRLRNKGERKDCSGPRVDVISEASSNSDDSDISKSSRRTDSGSGTNDAEIAETEEQPTTTRNLRSRSKTPDREVKRVITPKPGPKSRKSLSRLVLEANAFKTHTLERHEAEINESENNSILQDDSDSLGTPVKQNTSPDNLLNVTLSPIINKSILQTPTDESVLYDSSDKVEQVAEVLPKLEETYLENSVLKSYQSSLADDSEISMDDEVAMRQELDDSSFHMTPGTTRSVLQDISSLITSDSDVDVDENAQVIQENTQASDENESEAPPESSEEESDESDSNSEDDSDNEDDNDSDKENRDNNHDNLGIIEEIITEEFEASASEGSESESEIDEAADEQPADNEVITLEGSSQESSSSGNSSKLQIDESQGSGETKDSQDIETPTIFGVTMNEENLKIIDNEKNKELSILTDDNSVLVTDDSSLQIDTINEMSDFGHTNEDSLMEHDPASHLQVNITVNPIEEETIDNKTDEPNPLEIDVVDAVTPNNETSILGKEQPNDLQIESKHSEIDKEKEYPGKTLRRSTREKSIEKTEQKIPARRTRANSNASNKSNTETTEVETPITPLRRRLRTPSGDSETRRIMTRRASKELTEPIIEEADNASVLTPRRRSRSKSKPLEDSVISEKTHKIDIENEPKPIKGRRRSILNTKVGADLGVIPETTEDPGESSSDIIKEYAQGSRESILSTTQRETNVEKKRLTRTQKHTLETWLDSKATPPKVEKVVRPRKSSSRVSTSSDGDGSVDNAPGFNVPTTDSVSLLNKKSLEGVPDREELQFGLSTEPLVNDVKPKPRISRAMSESKAISKNVPTRRLSVDVGKLAQSPLRADSPRERRACFTRAVEALHTPRGRRASTDQRSEVDSNPGSPAQPSEEQSVTPARRRSRASTPTLTKAETPRRGKKN